MKKNSNYIKLFFVLIFVIFFIEINVQKKIHTGCIFDDDVVVVPVLIPENNSLESRKIKENGFKFNSHGYWEIISFHSSDILHNKNHNKKILSNRNILKSFKSK